MNSSVRTVLAFFFLIPGLLVTDSVWSADSPKAEISLISNLTHINKNRIPVLAVVFILPKGWETFWRNPGDVGYGVKFNWNGSENINKFNVLWPIPEHSTSFGYHLNVYKNKVVFPVLINPVDANKPLLVKLKVEYLLCQPGACIPHESQLSLSIPYGQTEPNQSAPLIDQAMKQVPSSGPSALMHIKSIRLEKISDKALLLGIDFKVKNSLKNADLFLEGSKDLSFAPPQLTVINSNEGYFQVRVTKNELSDSTKSLVQLLKEPLRLTLVNDNQAIEFVETVQE